MSQDTFFILLWASCAFLNLAGMAIGFFWAARNGQFGSQERARYLALDSGIPEDTAKGEKA